MFILGVTIANFIIIINMLLWFALYLLTCQDRRKIEECFWLARQKNTAQTFVLRATYKWTDRSLRPIQRAFSATRRYRSHVDTARSYRTHHSVRDSNIPFIFLTRSIAFFVPADNEHPSSSTTCLTFPGWFCEIHQHQRLRDTITIFCVLRLFFSCQWKHQKRATEVTTLLLQS